MNLRSLLAILIFSSATLAAQNTGYLGFDSNEYPGDANLKSLRKTFSYAGYWLNNPPGASSNSWAGHRSAVESAGFGFLVLFNGRLYAELKSGAKGVSLGKSMRRRRHLLRGGKASRTARSSFWIRSRAGACCPSKRLTSMPGLMALLAQDFAREFTARGSRIRMTKTSLLRKISGRKPAGGRSAILWRAMPARPRLAVFSPLTHRPPSKAVPISQMSGSSHSRRAARISRRTAATIRVMEAAIRRGFLPSSGCTLMLIRLLRLILRRGELTSSLTRGGQECRPHTEQKCRPHADMR
jgi:hypothetical protein